MYSKQIYEYQGVEYSISQLSRQFNIRRDILSRRLKSGWSVEKAVNTPTREMMKDFDKELIGKQIPVIFKSSPPVLPEMQPILGKQYIATVCGTKETAHSHIYYIITLENGKKLITYPNECYALRAVIKQAE